MFDVLVFAEVFSSEGKFLVKNGTFIDDLRQTANRSSWRGLLSREMRAVGVKTSYREQFWSPCNAFAEGSQNLHSFKSEIRLKSDSRRGRVHVEFKRFSHSSSYFRLSFQ
jgi:hypothetical protein